MVFEVRSQGREVIVKFTCFRCKETEFLPYDEAMKGETYGYLHNSELPEGWEKVGYSTILCPECLKQYKLFMGY